jgi:hypothetical protein
VISFGFTRLPLTWCELITRTIKEFVADNGLGLAAQLAYYFFFSLFPALLMGIALASFFPLEHFLDRIVSTLGGVVPADVITIIQEQIWKISRGNSGGILTCGLVLALWSRCWCSSWRSCCCGSAPPSRPPTGLTVRGHSGVAPLSARWPGCRQRDAESRCLSRSDGSMGGGSWVDGMRDRPRARPWRRAPMTAP